MAIWFILVSAVFTPIYTKDSQFECGSHGRFEYCIDGNLDCIVGCHCHPGYFFDTYTKICEPNIKLRQNRRQQYEDVPTHTAVSQVDSPEVVELTTYFPTTSALDEHVDTIAKNADDLGDWLYNQFYKTIESQVINKTNGNTLTRRSGNGPHLKVNKKKRNKKETKNREKKVSIKRKRKKDDLRRKLLRITENDSLFDSNTDTDDSSDSSSGDEAQESRDKEHGHKKFVIVNKKPKPPLPSFIFLPNLETPFFPPVGLPPPALPMYPMVPVPPVLPAYIFSITDVPPNRDETGTPNTTVTSSSHTTLPTITTVSAQPSITEASPQSQPEPKRDTQTSTDLESTTPKESEQKVLRFKKRKKKHMRSGGNDVLRRLQELVKNAAQNSAIKKNDLKTLTRSAQDLDGETLEINETFSDESMKNDNFKQRANDKAPLKQEDTVDFKYLSQLIHKIDYNDTGQPTRPMFQSNIKTHKSHNDLEKKNRILNLSPKLVQPSRRYNVQMNPQESITSDNSFYANLGRQIATLIRGVDSRNDRQINIEIEHMDHNTPSHPIFSELSYAPHSYWERFVRSPMNYLQQYRKKNEYLNSSNEILYNIEDKVEIAASTMSPMSLQEIENVINVIDGAQDDIQGRYFNPQHIRSSNNTLDVNLWPQELPTHKVFFNSAKPVVRKVQNYYNLTKKYTSENNLRSDSSGIRMQNLQKFTTWLGTEHTVNKISKNKMENTELDKTNNDINKILSIKNEIPMSFASHPNIPNYVNLPKRASNMLPTRRTNIKYQAVSPLFDYNQKRFLNVNNQHPFYNNLLELQFPTIAKSFKKPLLRTVAPSYFHHEVHHFDYID